MEEQRRRPWLAGLAGGVLLALLIAPATRWMTVAHIRLATGLGFTHDTAYLMGDGEHGTRPDEIGRRAREFAAAHPDDIGLQIAALTIEPPGSGKPGEPPTNFQRLAPLVAQYPNSAIVCANYLRYANTSAVLIRRPQDSAFLDQQPVQESVQKLSDEADLDAYDAAAARGEQLESDNAYFPLMRASGLFAAGRDREALDALHRAAARPRWEEHYDAEVEGKLRLVTDAFGENSAFVRTGVLAGVLFPHLAQMRATARAAAVCAIRAEQDGKPEEGMSIRRDLMHIGALLRVQGRSLISNLVGMAITSIGEARPGGAPALKRPSPLQTNGDDLRRKNLERFTEYAERTGHAEEARWARDEFAASERIRKSVLPYPDDFDIVRMVGRLGAWWGVCLSALTNATWMLALGGVAALLCRSKRVRAGKPLAVQTTIGLVSGLAITAVGIAAALTGPAVQTYFLAAFGTLLVVTPLLCMVAHRAGGLRVLAAILYTMAAAGVACGFGYLLAFGPWTLVRNFARMLAPESQWPEEATFNLVSALCVMPAAALLVACGLSIVSIACRVPLSVGLARGMRGAAVPVACLLVIGYGAAVLGAMRQEARVNYVDQRWLEHEGKFLAGARSNAWPGPVHEQR